MNFCSHCGAAQIRATMPYGDIGLHYICDNCGQIHYQRHSVVAGCVATFDDRVLLCRRAIEPYSGLWTIPAGYVEIGETLEEGAIRETREECGAAVGSLNLLALYDLPMFSEIYVIFAARLAAADFCPGPESLEVKLFTAEQIEWKALAFPMVREALRDWMAAPQPTPVAKADFFWGPDGGVRVRRKA
jgi:ADP-ribose pyrophosphatase YjhB (NUDIX family)